MLRSPRNKTIDFSAAEGAEYLARCIAVTEPAGADAVRDRVIRGDSFAVLPCLPAGIADLVIADPPYNLDYDFDGAPFRRMAEADYLDYTRRWLALVQPLLRSGGSIYVCCDWRCSGAVGAALGELFTVRSRITWQREKGRGAASNWKNTAEDIWFATAGEGYTFNLDAVKLRRRVVAPYRTDGAPRDWEATPEGNFRLTCPGNFWDDITVPYWSMPENTAHPTQKPEKLLARLILASSDAGDTVLDPFLGSGSTAVAAKKLGRHFVGVEQSAQYCAWAQYRLERAETDRRIQGYENGVFLERNARK